MTKVSSENSKLRLVKSIQGIIQSTNRTVNIRVSGRNVIIVGANGSGKTSFLTGVFNALKLNLIDGHLFKVDYHKNNVDSARKLIETQPDSPSIQSYRETHDHAKEILDSLVYPFTLGLCDPEKFSSLYKSNMAVVRIFEAGRKAAIKKVTSATGRSNSISDSKNYGVDLEQHLVNLQVRSGLAMRKGNHDRVQKILGWFNDFTENLKFLFENECLSLDFDDDELCFFISQPDRPSYSFQTLSSGYLAIFDIYADLLMRAEHRDITPSELIGIVLIDEIDAHLHISLQRKILPFLIKSFPCVQFVVTTHSPFVVISVDDALIYDISTGAECDDLSMYSVEAVIEGLLGVPSVSRKLEDTVTSLVELTSKSDFSLGEAETLLSKISPFVDSLDDESKLFYEASLYKFIKRKQGGENV
ncbi:AAA family ATPase [Pseudomonas prosekii]|uniref:AAA family ATPase n=1 Tax=Pseudomonas prosekii TaxID=1148509 RepID=A0A3L8CBA0_9PSED|nr:AAA family ATPase [Pseudomonas prosekii]RLU05038.1 AAA family ATPase [Pseudomonas prosekii]RLU05413.1 AAA family ATPase [Pseudomonas prosekii]